MRSASDANDSVSICGTASATERYERSIVTTPIGALRGIADRSPRFVRSRFTTRLWFRRSPRSWPWPASTANTRRAPCSSSTRVKPPADAPRSTHSRSVTSTANPSSAARSLSSPRSARGGLITTDASARTCERGFVTTRPSIRTCPATSAPSGSARSGRARATWSSTLRNLARDEVLTDPFLSRASLRPALPGGPAPALGCGRWRLRRPRARRAADRTHSSARVVRAEPAAHGRELVGAFPGARDGERLGIVAADQRPVVEADGRTRAVEDRERAGAHEPRVGPARAPGRPPARGAGPARAPPPRSVPARRGGPCVVRALRGARPGRSGRRRASGRALRSARDRRGRRTGRRTGPCRPGRTGRTASARSSPSCTGGPAGSPRSLPSRASRQRTSRTVRGRCSRRPARPRARPSAEGTPRRDRS